MPKSMERDDVQTATSAAAAAGGEIRGLAEELDAVYVRVRAEVGARDLEHITRVAAYSRAIEARSAQLIRERGSPRSFERGVVLGMLHVLLEFSELGHAIMHGGYDHLPDAGPFHSDRWVWDFVTDPREWKVMHHRNHHPFTNIVGVDHDLGYSFLRFKPGQSWYPHTSIQPLTLGVLLVFHLYYFALYTATSAARTEGRPVLSWDTFRPALRMIGAHAKRRYVQEPIAAGASAGRTLLGNYLATTLGYDLTIAILLLEHHADNVRLFHDPGPGETRDEWYARQILATTNFTPLVELDAYFQRVLHEEVAFEGRPGFEVFYGGLDTHLEHHLFPDLPPLRQRELTAEIRAICERRGLPYNVVPVAGVLPQMVVDFVRWVAPVGERDAGLGGLLARPRELWRRIARGVRYQPSRETYLATPRMFDVEARVLSAESLAGGAALALRIELPRGWDHVRWGAGAFVSLRVAVGDATLVRQYSLLRDSEESRHLEICVKRVAGGRVSNHLNDHLRAGMTVKLVGPPTSEGEFVMTDVPSSGLFIAGGVGVTPVLAMLRRARRIAPGADLALCYFNRDARAILFESELVELAASTKLQLHLFCDDASRARARPGIRSGPFSAERLLAAVPDAAAREVYACAPEGMVEALRTALYERGLPPTRFHTETFTPAPTPRGRQPADDATQYRIRFVRSGRELSVLGSTTLLDAARAAGVHVPTGCERGLCKACVTPKLRGTTQHDERLGTFLPRVTVCDSLPRSDLDLDL